MKSRKLQGTVLFLTFKNRTQVSTLYLNLHPPLPLFYIYTPTPHTSFNSFRFNNTTTILITLNYTNNITHMYVYIPIIQIILSTHHGVERDGSKSVPNPVPHSISPDQLAEGWLTC